VGVVLDVDAGADGVCLGYQLGAGQRHCLEDPPQPETASAVSARVELGADPL